MNKHASVVRRVFSIMTFASFISSQRVSLATLKSSLHDRQFDWLVSKPTLPEVMPHSSKRHEAKDAGHA
jgi:hypothetical protein